MTVPQKDYAVIIDGTRTPFTKSSTVPTKTTTLQDILPEDKFDEFRDLLLSAAPNAHEAHNYLHMPIFTPAPTKENKVGAMAHADPLDMAAKITGEVVQRTLIDNGIDPAEIKGVYYGAVHQEGPQGLNIGRNLVLHPDSKLPQSVPGISVDMFCASSGEAISICKDKLENSGGHINLLIAGGVQSMSQIAMGGNNNYINPKVYDGNAKGFMNMGITAENLVEMYGITRQEQEEFALRSHQRATAAQERGHFKNQITPVVEGVDQDDCIRPDTTLKQMATRKPAFKSERDGGTVTAATSSPTSDGASVVIMGRESYARANNLPVMCRVISTATVGCAPEIMGIGPVEAAKEALHMAGKTMSQMADIQLNEAFAAQVLSCLREFDKQGMPVDMDKFNVNGGALALSHPLAATLARIFMESASNLKPGEYGLVMACIGGGQGFASVIQKPPAPQL